jgi:hypothetical protein
MASRKKSSVSRTRKADSLLPMRDLTPAEIESLRRDSVEGLEYLRRRQALKDRQQQRLPRE